MTYSNHYATLALGPKATPQEIKASYRALSLIHHPDRGGSTETMTHLNEAYRLLSNPLLKREYDQTHTPNQHPQTSTVSYSHVRQTPTSRDTEDVIKRAYTNQHTADAEKPPARQNRFWSWFAATAIFVFGFFGYELFSILQPQTTVATTSATNPSIHQTSVSGAYQRSVATTNSSSTWNSAAESNASSPTDTPSSTIDSNSVTSDSSNTTTPAPSHPTDSVPPATRINHHKPIKQQLHDFIQ